MNAVARGCSRASFRSQYEADAADSLNERRRPAAIDLPAQVRNVHVDDIVERGCPADLVPNVLGEHLARNDLSWLAHEVCQQIKFTRGQIDALISATDAARLEIYRQVGQFPPQGLGPRSTAQERAESRHKLCKGKRLHEIVIRAGLEPQHAVGDR